jgi:hypothetical protein
MLGKVRVHGPLKLINAAALYQDHQLHNLIFKVSVSKLEKLHRSPQYLSYSHGLALSHGIYALIVNIG